jgi:hypothetical protein
MSTRTLTLPLLLLAAAATPVAAQQRGRAVIHVGDILSVSELAPDPGAEGDGTGSPGRRPLRLLIRANRPWRLMVTVVPGGAGTAGGDPRTAADRPVLRVRSVKGEGRVVEHPGEGGRLAGPAGAGMVEVARSDRGGVAVVELEIVGAPESQRSSVEATVLYTLAALD